MNYEFVEKTKSSYEVGFKYTFEEEDLDKNETFYELILRDKKYCFANFCQDFYFEKDNVIIINMWNRIVIFSVGNGEILFYSGLFDSFVGIESLGTYFLVITDTTVFKVNKFLFFVYDFNSFSNNILDYKISESLEEIAIKFVEEEMQDDVILKI